MKPLTIDSFKPHKIRAVSSDQKSVDDFNYTSVCFEYNGDKIPPLGIDGSLNLKIVRAQFIHYPLIVMNLWKNSSMNYEELLPMKPVDWFSK